MKTKLHLLSCIGSLSQVVAKLQQNWNELTLYRKTAGLAPTEEESVLFLAKEKKKRSKRVAQSVITSTKHGHKKAMAEPASIPGDMAIPLEEQIHDQVPPPSPQTLHKKNTVQKKTKDSNMPPQAISLLEVTCTVFSRSARLSSLGWPY